MDTFTSNHLESYIRSYVWADEQEDFRSFVHHMFAHDPDEADYLANQGWHVFLTVFRHANEGGPF